MAAKSGEAQLIMRLSAETKQLNRSIEKFERKINGSTRTMNKSWDKGMSKMERRARAFGKNAGKAIAAIGIGSAVGFVAVTKQTLQFADDLQHLSEQIGVSAETLQEYGFVASRLGLSQETINKAFKIGTKNVGEFANSGIGLAADALKELGVANDITSGKITNVGEIMEIVIARLGEEENALKRAGLAQEIFGRQGVEMSELLGLGTKAIGEMKQEARDLGAVLDNEAIKKASDANDTLGKLADTIRGNVRGAIVELAPEIEDMANALIDQIPGLVQWFTAAIDKADEFGDALTRLSGNRVAPKTADDATEQIKSINRLERSYKDLQKAREDAAGRKSEIDLEVAVKGTLVTFDIQKEKKNIDKNLEQLKKELARSVEKEFSNKELAKFKATGGDLSSLLLERKNQLQAEKRAIQQAERESGRTNPTSRTTTVSGGSSGGISGSSKAQDEAQKEALRQLSQRTADAKALLEAARTPIEEYNAALAEIDIIAADPLLANAAGLDAVGSAKIDALIELAEATDSYGDSVKALQALTASGDVTGAQTDEALAKLRELFKLEEKAAEAEKKRLDEAYQLREEKYEQLLRELEFKAALAATAGNFAEEEQLQRQIDLLIRKNELQREGVSESAATDTAKGEQKQFDIARQEGEIRSVIKGAASAGFRDGIDGVKDYLSDALSSAAGSMFDKAIDGLLDAVLSGFGGIGGGAGGGGILGALGGIFAGLFDSGGVIGARQIGIVGERGPELVASGAQPLRVLSRVDTAKAMNGVGAVSTQSGAPVIFAPVNNFHGFTQGELTAQLDQRDAKMKRQVPAIVSKSNLARRRASPA